jgi:hypothetical protein
MAWRTGGLACAALLCVPLLGQTEARADTVPLAVAFSYAAVPDCPEASEFKAIVIGRLGYDPFREDAPPHVTVHIASRAPAFEGRIEWRDAEGNWAGDRTFPSRSNDCRELARAMAFALALQIQLSASTRAPPGSITTPPAETGRTVEAQAPPPAPPATPEAPSKQPDVPAPHQAAAAPDRGPRSVLAVGAGVSLGFGVSSSALPLGRVFGRIAWPHASLELAAEAGLPTNERRADGAGFSQQELLLDVAGCGTLARWSACLLAKGGVIRIVGDIDEPASPWGPLLQAGLRLAVMQPLGRRVYVAARAEGLVIVTRWRVSLDRDPVWTSSRFAETLGIDVGVRFP